MCFMVSFVADLWVKWRVKTAKKMISKSEIFSLVGWLMSHERPRTPKTSQWLQALDSADSPLSDIVFADRLIDSQVHRLELQWLTITTEICLRASFLVFRKSLEGHRAKHNKFYLMSIEESELIFFLSFLCWCACLHNSRINVFKLNNPLKRW